MLDIIGTMYMYVSGQYEYQSAWRFLRKKSLQKKADEYVTLPWPTQSNPVKQVNSRSYSVYVWTSEFTL